MLFPTMFPSSYYIFFHVIFLEIWFSTFCGRGVHLWLTAMAILPLLTYTLKSVFVNVQKNHVINYVFRNDIISIFFLVIYKKKCWLLIYKYILAISMIFSLTNKFVLIPYFGKKIVNTQIFLVIKQKKIFSLLFRV